MLKLNFPKRVHHHFQNLVFAQFFLELMLFFVVLMVDIKIFVRKLKADAFRVLCLKIVN